MTINRSGYTISLRQNLTVNGTVTSFSDFTAYGKTPPPAPPTPETNIDTQPQEPQNSDSSNNGIRDIYSEVRAMMQPTLTRAEITLHNMTWNAISQTLISTVPGLTNGELGITPKVSFEWYDKNPVIIDETADYELANTGTDGMIDLIGKGDYSTMSLWASKYEKHPLFKSKVDKLLDSLTSV